MPCIYCDMEQETILYYYPMPEQLAKSENRYAAKRHWFQEASLKTVTVVSQTEFQVLGCAIPPFYYRHKPWKPQILSGMMETVLGDAAGMIDTWVHPETAALLTDEYRMKWMPREGTVRMLVKHLPERYAEGSLKRCGMVTVLLGQPADTDRQMEMTWELLQPFLPKVNRMLIYYERQEAGQDKDRHEEPAHEDSFSQGSHTYGLFGIRHRKREDYGGASEPEEHASLNKYLEEYYYEYGLVPQLEPYVKAYAAGREASAQHGSGGSGLRCGREKCGGIILDYCGQFRYPKILPEGCIYIDTVSVGEKERLLGRKGLPVPYLSPLKYLDTIVKNSYDRKVKKGQGIF